MDAETAWNLLRALADDPRFVFGLFGVVVILNLLDGRRSWAQGLKFPCFLFLLRLGALYFPVPGTISTPDRVIFWSLGAYVYFAIIFVVMGLVLFHVLSGPADSARSDESNGGVPIPLSALITAYVGFEIASWMLLPIDGLSHIYMPALCFLGSIKVLLVSQVLLPLTWLVLLLQLCLLLASCVRAGREVNKLVLALLMLGGFTQFCYQAINFGLSPGIEAIRGEWKTSRPSERSPAARLKPGEPDAKDFLPEWERQVERTAGWGVNVVEKVPDDLDVSGFVEHTIKRAIEQAGKIRRDSDRPLAARPAAENLPEGARVRNYIAAIPDAFDGLGANRVVREILPLSGLVLVLLALAERFRSGDERQPELGQDGRQG